MKNIITDSYPLSGMKLGFLFYIEAITIGKISAGDKKGMILSIGNGSSHAFRFCLTVLSFLRRTLLYRKGNRIRFKNRCPKSAQVGSIELLLIINLIQRG